MKKALRVLLSAFLVLATLSGCGGGGGKDTGNKKIVVWVGEESAEFYQKVCDEYVASHKDFGYTVEVKGMDTGAVAGTVTQDPSAAADIYTVAHDNIGKLAANQCAKPFTDESLLAQVNADNPEAYQKVIYSELNGKQYVYGVPYISQALFLYYNKSLVTVEQAKSFEGLLEAAKMAGNNAVTVTGDDGFNNSFALLATRVADHGTSVKIYEGAAAVSGGSKGESNCQGDDTVAIVRWLQAYRANPNGFTWVSDSGWEADFRKNAVCGVIGGAWHYKSAVASVGETNLGITLIPTLTLTKSDVEGLEGVAAGDVYRGGTFADCKVFMLNSNSATDKYGACQQLVKYLSSKEVQQQSFLSCMNVPAYAGAAAFIEQVYNEGKITEAQYALAASQIEMSEWGIPQPFLTGTLNTYYYSKNAPSVFRALIDVKDYPETGNKFLTKEELATVDGIRKGLYMIEYIWMHGRNPESFPEKLPVEA